MQNHVHRKPCLAILLLVGCLCAFGAKAQISDPSAPVESSVSSNWWNENPWGDPDRGFNWYPDPKEAAKPKEEEKKAEKPKTIYEMTTLEEVKKELDRIKGVAVVNPTEKNVLEFLQAQNFVMDKSSLFADVARRVVWANPDVNYSARSPVVNYARTNQRERVNKKRDENIAHLAGTHGLLFFARSDCDFCHDEAPILKGFGNRTGMNILAISMDGGAIPMFPDAKPDNGISMIVTGGSGIQIVPALFLIDRKTKATIPLGTGVMAADEIAERIRVLTMTTPGQEF